MRLKLFSNLIIINEIVVINFKLNNINNNINKFIKINYYK